MAIDVPEARITFPMHSWGWREFAIRQFKVFMFIESKQQAENVLVVLVGAAGAVVGSPLAKSLLSSIILSVYLDRHLNLSSFNLRKSSLVLPAYARFHVYSIDFPARFHIHQPFSSRLPNQNPTFLPFCPSQAFLIRSSSRSHPCSCSEILLSYELEQRYRTLFKHHHQNAI